MCNKLTLLAQQSEWRYIAQCEHQTVHLHWDHLTLSLPPTAFLQLSAQIVDVCNGTSATDARTADAPASDLSLPTTVAEELSSPPTKKPLRLRVNRAIVEIPAVDLVTLTALLHRARGVLQQAADRTGSVGAIVERSPLRSPLPWTQPNRFSLTHHLN